MAHQWAKLFSISLTLALTAFYLLYEPKRKINGKYEKKNARCISGLPNCGTSCYINSLLQSIASLNEFIKFIRAYLDIDNIILKHNILVTSRILLNIIDYTNNSPEQDINCSDAPYLLQNLNSSLKNRGWKIGNGEQDCFEYFHVLMDVIDEEISEFRKIVSSGIIPIHAENICLEKGINFTPIDLMNNFSVNNNGMNRVLLFNNIHNPFIGIMGYILKCQNCGFQYPIKFQSFNHLTLPLLSQDVFCIPNSTKLLNSLENCLEIFFKEEILNDAICDKCSYRNDDKNFLNKVNLKKISYISRYPKCLCIHFQRTQYSSDHNSGSYKRNGKIDIPFNIQMSKYNLKNHWVTPKKPLKRSTKSQVAHFYINEWYLLNRRLQSNMLCLPTSIQTIPNKTLPTINNYVKSMCNRDGYSLAAIINHQTLSEKSGHFISLRAHPNSNHLDLTSNKQWYMISDQSVVPYDIKSKSNICTNAYMLFYERLK